MTNDESTPNTAWYATPEWSRTSTWTRIVGFLMIPGTLLMAFHIWLGRAYFGAPVGWMAVFLMMWGWPLLILWLAPVLPVLVRTWRHRRMTFSRVEATVQLVTWAAMFIAGLTLPDYGDAPDYGGSALSELAGTSVNSFTPLFYLAVALTLVLPIIQTRISARSDTVDTSSAPQVVGPITQPRSRSAHIRER